MPKTAIQYKDSGVDWIGKIPEDWDIRKIKGVTRLNIGWTPDTAVTSYFEGNNLWATIADMNSKEILETKNRISDKAIQDSRIKKVKKGSLLYSFKLSVGKVAFAGQDLYTNEAIAAFEPSDRLDTAFAYYAFSDYLLNNANENIYGAKLLNQYLMNNAIIALPPLKVQKKCSDFLDSQTSIIDRAIEEKRKLIDLLKEKRTAIINKAVTRGLDENVELVDSGVEWIGKVPRGWRVEGLKYVTNLVSRGESPEYVEESTTPIINQACIYWDGLHLDGLKYDIREDISRSKGMLIKGDVLMNSTGTGTLGRVASFELEGSYLADSHVTIIRPKVKRLNPNYLRYLFGTLLYQGYIYASAVTGSTNQIELSRDRLLEVPILLPEINSQNQIAEKLKKIDYCYGTVINKVEESIQLLSEYRSSLISNTVTGKLII